MTRLTLIENAEVYAPEPLGRRSLLLGGGRVLWLGEEPPPLPAELAALRVDLAGRRLVPGFVDVHVHVLGGGCEAGPESSVPPLGVGSFLDAGVTTVVGLLGTDDLVRTTAQLVYAVNGLRAGGLSAWCYTGGYHVPPRTLTGSVRGDIVHVEPILGLGELAISDHRSSQPTRDELLRLASEVHVGGLMSGKAGVLHLHLGDGPRGLALVRECLDTAELPARVYYPTHVNRRAALFDEALELARRGVPIDVTASPDDDGDEVPASRAVERILDEGIGAGRWSVSSDAGGSIPTFDEDGRLTGAGVGDAGTLPALLARLLDAGRSLESVLPGLTRHPAEALRLERKGRIEVGADADLVVLDERTHGVREVWSGGVRRRGG